MNERSLVPAKVLQKHSERRARRTIIARSRHAHHFDSARIVQSEYTLHEPEGGA
jgi:hypothetical protein